MVSPPGSSVRGPAGRKAPAVITDAATGRSRELRGREKRYAITMGFRTACFIAMVFVPGPLRWVLFGCAVFLPYVAVVLANQSHQTGPQAVILPGAPLDAPQLTVGNDPDIISGDLDDSDGRQDRVA